MNDSLENLMIDVTGFQLKFGFDANGETQTVTVHGHDHNKPDRRATTVICFRADKPQIDPSGRFRISENGEWILNINLDPSSQPAILAAIHLKTCRVFFGFDGMDGHNIKGFHVEAISKFLVVGDDTPPKKPKEKCTH